MSKSLGTGLDPIDYIESLGYGADALRYALILRASQTQQDFRFGEKMLDDVRNFNNKIWNIARFVRMNLEGIALSAKETSAAPPGGAVLGAAERWILSRYARTAREVTAQLEAFEFDKAARALYDFLWGTYADWYVEFAKVTLSGEDTGERRATQWTLWRVLEGTLRLLHPIMPHITEEIWHLLPHDGESIMIAPWPAPPAGWLDEGAEGAVERLMEVIRAIRSLRVDLGVSAGAILAPRLRVSDEARRRVLKPMLPYVRALARAEGVTLERASGPTGRAAAAIAGGIEVLMPVEESELPAVRRRLDQELARLRSELERVEGRLASGDFITRAPAHVVEAEHQRAADLRGRAAALERYHSALR
jgi:valyl-tRNA synthetase